MAGEDRHASAIEASAPRHAVYVQARRWIAAGRLKAMVHDLRALLRLGDGRDVGPRGRRGRLADAAVERRERPPGGLRRLQAA